MPQPPQINLNLDTIEREQTYQPFTVVIGERSMTLVDPKDIDWKTLLDIDEPVKFLGHVFATEEDKAFFKKQDFPGWKLDMLIQQYTTHFGLTNQGGGVASRL